MAKYDIEALLTPLSDDSPSGPNLEYDAAFMALERAAAPKAEKSIGDAVIAAEETDWDDIESKAISLFDRTRDLRVAVHLMTAWAKRGGFAGLDAGLALVRGLVEQFWPDLHPQLDPDDDDDPTLRVNSVAPLSSITGLLRDVRQIPFTQSVYTGKMTLRDLKIANGSLKLAIPEGEDAPQTWTQAQIEGCCMDDELERLQGVSAAVESAISHVRAIDAGFEAHIGSLGPDLRPLVSDLSELDKFLKGIIARRIPSDDAGPAGSDDEADGVGTVGGTGTAGGGGRGVPASTGQISGPRDVIKRIDEICDYYAKNEPSSPVPMILNRAKRLVGVDFLALLKDLAPDGIDQLKVVTGYKEPDEEEEE